LVTTVQCKALYQKIPKVTDKSKSLLSPDRLNEIAK